MILFKLLLLTVLAETPIQITDSLDRIELLILRENWQEAVGSLKDIPSGDRTRRYNDLLEKAAIGFVRSESSNLSNAERIADELPNTFLSLRNSPAFQNERDRVSQLGFSVCFNAGKDINECALRLVLRIEKDPHRTNYLLWAAMALYVQQKQDFTFKILSLGSTTKGRRQICSSVSVLEIAVNMLAHEPPYDERFLKLVKESCWHDIKIKLAKEIALQKEEAFLKNACALFREMKTPHARCLKLRH